jgi:manganese transport protein
MNSGWRNDFESTPSLPEAYATVPVSNEKGVSFFKKLLAFSGPGLMVAVGYMDPGNWATDLAGGAQFGYTLLFVIFFSNLMAMLLQHLSLKLGIVTGKDLAQACRHAYSKPVNITLWILCEIAICACDLAEVIGSAIALNLLFHIPLSYGILITALDVMLIFFLQYKGFRALEVFVAALIFIIGGCFIYEIIIANPEWNALLRGFIPTPELIKNPEMLYIAIGILGATVMPHNLYLHSSIVQTRAFQKNDDGKKFAIKFATIDSNIALFCAFLVNAAILILSAAVFHGTPNSNIADLSDAYHLLSPALSDSWASILFAVALLAAGHNSTLTGTLAGQIVMEGFLNLKIRPWLRRLVTRSIAIVPAIIIATIYGEKGIGKLLIFSQVILSLQLSFAVVPLIQFTNDPKKMGNFANKKILRISAWVTAFLIIGLNAYLLVFTLKEWFQPK